MYESIVDFYPNTVEPARLHIPKWYKEINLWKNNEIFSIEKRFNKTLKHCASFLDSFTTGYMIVLPYDIYVKNNNGSPYITCKGDSRFSPKERTEDNYMSLVPTGHNPLVFTWNFFAAIKVPIGYSFLLTHPINRHDLPFTTLSGVIDGGLVTSPIGILPFYIKEGFEGIISQGTPIAQIIPFKQQNWSSKITNGLIAIGEKHAAQGKAILSGWYKKTFWTRKNYD